MQNFSNILSTRLPYLLALYISVCTATTAHSQSVKTDFQTWSDINYIYALNKRSNLGMDGGIRGLVSRNDWNQFYIRPKIQYFMNSIVRLSSGLGIFNTISDTLDNTLEFRIFEEAKFSWPSINYGVFNHRIRLEQRFISYSGSNTELPNDYENRGRYQIGFESRDIQFGENSNRFYFLISAEWFNSFGDSSVEHFINNQRFLAGIGHRLNPSFRYEIQYILQNSKQFTEDGKKSNEHIIRVRFFITSFSQKAIEAKKQ